MTVSDGATAADIFAGQTTARSLPSPSARGEAIAALRANLIPAIVLWTLGVAILAAYHVIPAVHAALETLGRVKATYGFAYSMVGMVIFAGLVPYAMQRLVHPDERPLAWGRLAFLLAFWATKGVEIDAFYRLQSWCFGDAATAGTIFAKLAVDQFVYCPLWAMPTMTLALEWAQRPPGQRGALPEGMSLAAWCRRRLPPALVGNWIVSVPGVAIIYSLPPALQIPVQNLVLCLFVCVLLFITRGGPKAAPRSAGA